MQKIKELKIDLRGIPHTLNYKNENPYCDAVDKIWVKGEGYILSENEDVIFEPSLEVRVGSKRYVFNSYVPMYKKHHKKKHKIMDEILSKDCKTIEELFTEAVIVRVSYSNKKIKLDKALWDIHVSIPFKDMFNIIGVNLLFGQIHNDEFICFKENNKQPSEIRIRTLQSGVLLKTIPFKGNSGVLEIHDCYGDRFSESLQIDFKRMKKIEEKLITKEQELDKREKELNRREKKLNKREKN